jgi:hypothetical protein
MQEVWQKLHDFCAARQWRGFDPYDGLNSPLAKFLPGKSARQAWTQFHRRSPLNLRPLVGIQPTLNPKALALFAMGMQTVRSRVGVGLAVSELLEQLRQLQNPDGGWGYPFPWQSRAFYAPRGASNLICTVFAAKAFWECGGLPPLPGSESKLPHSKSVEGARQFIEKHLLRDGYITYIAGSDTQVHNVNMLGAALIGRRDCLEWSVKRQMADGSWWYGEADNQHWIDNFHTGFNLLALKETGWFPEAAARGFAYWDRTFWTKDFAPRYYHDRDYPLDIHCCATGILTYLAFGETEKAERVARWAVENLWDGRGFFWYQRARWFTNRICYMRWAQAWMYYALAKLNETTHR